MASESNVLPFPSNTRPLERDHVDDTTPRRAIGDVLRDERHHQERTLAEVAEAASVSLPYLSEVERGRKDVSSELLTAIADALELPLPMLFERAADRLRTRGQGLQGPRMQLLAA